MRRIVVFREDFNVCRLELHEGVKSTISDPFTDTIGLVNALESMPFTSSEGERLRSMLRHWYPKSANVRECLLVIVWDDGEHFCLFRLSKPGYLDSCCGRVWIDGAEVHTSRAILDAEHLRIDLVIQFIERPEILELLLTHAGPVLKRAA